MGLPALSIAVVGADHPNKRGPSRIFELQLCRPGEIIELRREPKNPADPRAVAVYSARGIQIGYIPAERAQWIGSMIDQGREVAAVFQMRTGYGAAIRVAFDGDVPTIDGLPTESAKPPPEPDFWPDYIPPDD